MDGVAPRPPARKGTAFDGLMWMDRVAPRPLGGKGTETLMTAMSKYVAPATWLVAAAF